MRCDLARGALGESMDERRPVGPEVRAHVRTCNACTRFERGAWRLRDLTRFEVAPEVPDLTDRIMARVREDAPPASPRPLRRGRAPSPHGRTWVAAGLGRAAVAVFLVGFAAGAVLTWGGVVPRKSSIPAALARDIPARLIGAAESLRGYRATFDITELDWTPAVPRRTFVAEVAFRAPEGFLVRVHDTTRYPSGAWPRNNLALTTDGRAWHATGPEPCPRALLPACPRAAPVERSVVGRAPFDAATAMPTDIIVPMTVLAAAGRVDVAGQGTAAGRDAVAVRLDAQDSASLLQYLRFLGSWRPFFPQDRVVLWLDRRTWFPLRYEVVPAPGEERAAWAAQNALPSEPPDRAVFTATARSFSTVPPTPELFRVPGRGTVTDQGFRGGPFPTVARGMEPASLGPLRPWRGGTFVRTTARPFQQSVVAYAHGLSWLTVTRVRGWNQDRAFGVGAFAEPVELADGTTGLYEPASSSEPRRVSLHTTAGEFLVATNLPRSALERVAASLPVRTLPEPERWRVHRWAGGVVEDGLTPGEGLARAGLPATMPGFVPPGYRPSVARLVRTPTGRALTIVFRRPAAELGGVGLVFTQGVGQTLAPPTEAGVLAVRVGSAAGRWTPGQDLLEWMDGGGYRSLSSPTLGLPTLLRVAESLLPAGEASRA